MNQIRINVYCDVVHLSTIVQSGINNIINKKIKNKTIKSYTVFICNNYEEKTIIFRY